MLKLASFKSAFIWLLLCLFAPMVAMAQTEPEPVIAQPDPVHQKAFDDCRSSNPAKVIEGCSQLVKQGRILKDDLPDVQLAIGMAHAELGQSAPAIEMLSEVIKIETEDADLFITRAMLYAGIGKFNEARLDADKALALKSDHHSGHLVRAKIAYAEADYQRTIKMTTLMLGLWPDDVEALVLRGQAYDVVGLYELGLADFDVAAEIEPDNPSIYFQRAISHLDNKYYDLASTDLKKVLELDVGYPKAFELLQRAQSNLVGASP